MNKFINVIRIIMKEEFHRETPTQITPRPCFYVLRPCVGVAPREQLGSSADNNHAL